MLALKTPCANCGYDGSVVARAISKGSARKIQVRCPSCAAPYELPIRDYGAALGLEPNRRRGSASRGPAWRPRDHQLFARYNWCCVYHEGSYEAALIRRRQLDSLTMTVSSEVIRDAGGVFATTEQLRGVSAVDPNLFGLVADHLIPRVVQSVLDDRWTAQQRRLMRNDWIVAACARCNGQRNQELETPQQLLYLYSRFVLAHRPGDDIDRLRETFVFVEVLQEIERYRIESGVEGPLRPARFARAAESDAG